MAFKRSAVRFRLAPPRFAAKRARRSFLAKTGQSPCCCLRLRVARPLCSRISFVCSSRTRCVRHGAMARASMWYVYILRSDAFPDQEYTGATADLKQRLADHNAGKSTHTAKFRPWQLIWYCAFPDKMKALDFEKYLKSHSGRDFAKKRLYEV